MPRATDALKDQELTRQNVREAEQRWRDGYASRQRTQRLALDCFLYFVGFLVTLALIGAVRESVGEGQNCGSYDGLAALPSCEVDR